MFIPMIAVIKMITIRYILAQVLTNFMEETVLILSTEDLKMPQPTKTQSNSEAEMMSTMGDLVLTKFGPDRAMIT